MTLLRSARDASGLAMILAPLTALSLGLGVATVVAHGLLADIDGPGDTWGLLATCVTHMALRVAVVITMRAGVSGHA